jgi:hypothetical protein
MWLSGGPEVTEQRCRRLELLAKGACPVLDLPTTIYGRKYTECDQWSGQTIARLQAEHPRLVVLSLSRRYGARYNIPAGFTSYHPTWIDSMTRLVAESLQALFTA